MAERQCDDCGHGFPTSETLCPHCGRPSLFPNVVAVGAAEEQAALQARYEAAKREAASRGAAAPIEAFERACEQSTATIARSLDEVLRLATSDLALYATFYQMQTQRIPRGLPASPGEPNWDKIRAVADEALFGKNKDEIRFAALSLDCVGLANYGDCTLILREEMIAHRASAIEENSVLFMKRHNVSVWGADNFPPGYRSTWEQRARVCVTKLAKNLAPAAQQADFAGILLKQGATSLEDEFVEVHVFGPMTVRTLSKVVAHKKPRRLSRAKQSALREKLAKWNVEFEEEP